MRTTSGARCCGSTTTRPCASWPPSCASATNACSPTMCGSACAGSCYFRFPPMSRMCSTGSEHFNPTSDQFASALEHVNYWASTHIDLNRQRRQRSELRGKLKWRRSVLLRRPPGPPPRHSTKRCRPVICNSPDASTRICDSRGAMALREGGGQRMPRLHSTVRLRHGRGILLEIVITTIPPPITCKQCCRRTGSGRRSRPSAATTAAVTARRWTGTAWCATRPSALSGRWPTMSGVFGQPDIVLLSKASLTQHACMLGEA